MGPELSSRENRIVAVMISDDSVSAGINRDGQISPFNKGQHATKIL